MGKTVRVEFEYDDGSLQRLTGDAAEAWMTDVNGVIATAEIRCGMSQLKGHPYSWEHATVAPPDFDADDYEGAMNYFRRRAHLVERHGWRWIPWRAVGDWGAMSKFRKDGEEERCAIFVFQMARGIKHLSTFVRNNPELLFLTLDDCNVASFYEKLGRDCLVLAT